MAVQIILQFAGKQLTIPINPEKLRIQRNASNEDIDIIGLGKATRKGAPNLTKVSIEGFFPAAGSYFYTGVRPKTCVDFINNIWATDNTNNNVAKIITSGLPVNLNMFFVIEEFVPEMRAGEEEDIYYTLSIKEYIPYGAKIVNVQQSGLAAARASSTAKVSSESQNSQAATQKTYTVTSGDCLWNIAKACCGDGSKWQELYNLNKSVIGSNPSSIKVGQVLILPDGWSSPTNVTKLSTVGTNKATQTVAQTATTTKQSVEAVYILPDDRASASNKNVITTTQNKIFELVKKGYEQEPIIVPV